jgi:hypothetical protein
VKAIHEQTEMSNPGKSNHHGRSPQTEAQPQLFSSGSAAEAIPSQATRLSRPGAFPGLLWGVPRDSRPNPVRARLRSLLLLAFGGASVIVTTGLSELGAAAGAFGASLGGSARVLTTAAAIALNVTLFIVAFRVLTARRVAVRQIRAGSALALPGRANHWDPVRAPCGPPRETVASIERSLHRSPCI